MIMIRNSWFICTDLEMDPRGNVKAVRGAYGSSNPKVYAAGGENDVQFYEFPDGNLSFYYSL